MNGLAAIQGKKYVLPNFKDFKSPTRGKYIGYKKNQAINVDTN